MSDGPTGVDGRLANVDEQLAEIMKPGTKSRWAKAAVQFLATALTSAAGGAGAFVMSMAGAGVDIFMGWRDDKQQEETNQLFAACIREHVEDLREVKDMVMGVVTRIPLVTDEAVLRRVESPEFQGLVRRAFNNWSRAEDEEKREIVRRLLTHAATLPVLDVELFRLFFAWARRYTELHSRMLRVLREHGQLTKLEIWQAMGGERRRDDSAEADVFGCLIMDLNFGHLVETVKPRAAGGQTLRKPRQTGPRRSASPYLQSAFDSSKDWELTAVGKMFVHHTMTEVVPKIAAPAGAGTADASPRPGGSHGDTGNG